MSMNLDEYTSIESKFYAELLKKVEPGTHRRRCNGSRPYCHPTRVNQVTPRHAATQLITPHLQNCCCCCCCCYLISLFFVFHAPKRTVEVQTGQKVIMFCSLQCIFIAFNYCGTQSISQLLLLVAINYRTAALESRDNQSEKSRSHCLDLPIFLHKRMQGIKVRLDLSLWL